MKLSKNVQDKMFEILDERRPSRQIENKIIKKEVTEVGDFTFDPISSNNKELGLLFNEMSCLISQKPKGKKIESTSCLTTEDQKGTPFSVNIEKLNDKAEIELEKGNQIIKFHTHPYLGINFPSEGDIASFLFTSVNAPDFRKVTACIGSNGVESQHILCYQIKPKIMKTLDNNDVFLKFVKTYDDRLKNLGKKMVYTFNRRNYYEYFFAVKDENKKDTKIINRFNDWTSNNIRKKQMKEFDDILVFKEFKKRNYRLK